MSKIIHITHFINPHCFYFKFDDDLHDTQLQTLEDDISKFARNEMNKLTQFTSIKGDIVAAYEISCGKWVRAEICENLNDFKRCILWAIDHGKQFQTAYKNIVPLPQHLIVPKVKGAQRGSIHGVNPARVDLNLHTLEKELNPCENWSEKAIDQCKRFIGRDNVLQTLFDIKHKRNDYFFGDLSIETLSQKGINTTDFGNALLSIEEGVRVDFQKEIPRITFKYDTFCNGNVSDTDTDPTIVTVVPNRNNIRQKLAEARSNQNSAPQPPSSIAPSRAASTVVPSEINGGVTRMQRGNRMRNSAPSIAPSTVVPSEINGGATRMNINHRQYRGHHGAAHMPAGFERDTHSFDKHNKRF